MQLLESNMRLKLSGPDYKDQDPVVALADFKKRVSLYERAYVPLGEYEERNNISYIQVNHQDTLFMTKLLTCIPFRWLMLVAR